MNDKLNVLIVDDNLIFRKFLTRVVEDIEGIELVQPAASGQIALKRLEKVPVDLVLMDMQMPGMSGLQTLKRIRGEHPDVGVIMISGEYGSDADQVVEALEMGALDFLPKGGMDGGQNSVLALRRHLLTLTRQYQGRRNLNLARRLAAERSAALAAGDVDSPAVSAEALGAAARTAPRRSVVPGRIDVIVMGASTGGPNALSEIIPRLPGSLRVPVLLVQHMPSFLTASLANSLDSKSALEVREAADGEELRPGTVYLAPGGRHMTVRKNASNGGDGGRRYMALSDGPPENSVRPSADVLFRSAAEAFGGRVMAVILTGMGSDGMKGVRALKEKGCYCLSQSEQTCVVYGMPRAVDEAALSDERVSLGDMAGRIIDIISGSER